VAELVPLDSRQSRIARLLLTDGRPASMDAIASELHLTPRVIRYNLPLIETYLRPVGLELVRRRGLGVWIAGDEVQRNVLLESLDHAVGVPVLDSEDRKLRTLARLLDAAPNAIHLADLEVELGASRPTARRDVRAAEAWLERHGLHLRRLPGVGVSVRGTEIDIRKGILALILDAVPADELFADHRVSAATEALDTFAAGLELPRYRAILADGLPEIEDGGPTASAAALYLGIVAQRVRRGRRVELHSGQLRSLIDHPVAVAASRIASAVEASVGLTLGEAEIAAITEFLLGFVELAEREQHGEAEDAALVDRLVEAAAKRLHASLADDEQLRRTLGEHLRRLRVRLRYGLPISNPLDREVRDRYPDVYHAVEQIVQEITVDSETVVPADELGFLTMYLAGSLERSRLRSAPKITVVCPAGMATAWILVSRLLAEFPQVEVNRVVSKVEYERDPDDGADLVVSTVSLDDVATPVPAILVNPLLRETDVRRLSRLLGEPTH
jgi:mannitol operon transcriptional antiterminator